MPAFAGMTTRESRSITGCASILLRQPESEEHDRKARELRQARHLAEREETDQKRKSRHQRREHRGAAGAEQHDRAGEEIGPSGAGEDALHDELHEILRKPQCDHALEAEGEPLDRHIDERHHAVTATARVGAMRQSRSNVAKPANISPAVTKDRSPTRPCVPIVASASAPITASPATMTAAPAARCAGSFSFSTNVASTSPPRAAQEGWITPPWASGTNKKPA